MVLCLPYGNYSALAGQKLGKSKDGSSTSNDNNTRIAGIVSAVCIEYGLR
jgi:hypothetical protein